MLCYLNRGYDAEVQLRPTAIVCAQLDVFNERPSLLDCSSRTVQLYRTKLEWCWFCEEPTHCEEINWISALYSLAFKQLSHKRSIILTTSVHSLRLSFTTNTDKYTTIKTIYISKSHTHKLKSIFQIHIKENQHQMIINNVFIWTRNQQISNGKILPGKGSNYVMKTGLSNDTNVSLSSHFRYRITKTKISFTSPWHT